MDRHDPIIFYCKDEAVNLYLYSRNDSYDVSRAKKLPSFVLWKKNVLLRWGAIVYSSVAFTPLSFPEKRVQMKFICFCLVICSLSFLKLRR